MKTVLLIRTVVLPEEYSDAPAKAYIERKAKLEIGRALRRWVLFGMKPSGKLKSGWVTEDYFGKTPRFVASLIVEIGFFDLLHAYRAGMRFVNE